MEYVKKPIPVSAVQWRGHDDPSPEAPELEHWQGPASKNLSRCDKCNYFLSEHARIPTLEGWHIVCPSDWIITGIQGERYPCKADIFEASYEPYPGERPQVVCLCGSTRFMDTFFEEGWRLTLEGKIVLSVGVCKHAEHHGAEALGPNVVETLDELHLRKIDMADEVHILNVGGYIGESTRNELEYAKAHGKRITFLEESTTKESMSR
jgi:hypothetical protein